MRRLLLLWILLLGISGCAPNPEELDRLMKEDPNFKQMVLTRNQMRRDIQLIKQDMLEKKKTVDAQVAKLRQDYDAYAKGQNAKIEKFQNTIEAYRNLLKRETETASAQLEAKRTELEGYEKTMADVKRVLRESKTVNLSAQEKEKWGERILMLSEKMRPLTEEIEELKAQIQLKKRKLGFLR